MIFKEIKEKLEADHFNYRSVGSRELIEARLKQLEECSKIVQEKVKELKDEISSILDKGYNIFLPIDVYNLIEKHFGEEMK